MRDWLDLKLEERTPHCFRNRQRRNLLFLPPSVNREHISSPESEQRTHAIWGKILIFEDGGQVAAQEIITSMKQRELVSPIIVQCSNRSRGVCGLLGLCSVYLFMPILRQGLFVRRTKILISVGKWVSDHRLPTWNKGFKALNISQANASCDAGICIEKCNARNGLEVGRMSQKV